MLIGYNFLVTVFVIGVCSSVKTSLFCVYYKKCETLVLCKRWRAQFV